MADAGHISDHDLERYLLGMVTQEEKLAPLEEHLLVQEAVSDVLKVRPEPKKLRKPKTQHGKIRVRKQDRAS